MSAIKCFRDALQANNQWIDRTSRHWDEKDRGSDHHTQHGSENEPEQDFLQRYLGVL